MSVSVLALNAATYSNEELTQTELNKNSYPGVGSAW